MSTNKYSHHNNENIHNKKIYVGNLPLSIDENDLNEIFGSSKYGTINYIDLKESGPKANKRQFAFITYEDHESAAKAISQLNLKTINGIPIRVSFAEQNFRRKRSPSNGNIVIRNIDPKVKPRSLNKYFQQFGEIIKFILTEDSSIAFIQYRQENEANQAIQESNGKILKGRKLIVRKANEPNLLIESGIPEEVKSKDSFDSWFEEILESGDNGKNINLKNLRKSILLFLPGKKNLKQGIFMFYDDRTAKRVMKIIKSKGINCKCINEDEKHYKLNKFDKEWKKETDDCLFIKNFPEDYDRKDIINFVKKFQGLSNFNIKGETKSFGFVYFNSKRDQINAIRKSILTTFQGKLKYPQQLIASYYVENKDEDLNSTKNEQNVEKLRKRIKSKYDEDSIQYQLFLQFSFDQINELCYDKNLYQKWIQNCNKLAKSNESKEDEDDKNEEKDDDYYEEEDNEEVKLEEKDIKDDDDDDDDEDNDYDDNSEDAIDDNDSDDF